MLFLTLMSMTCAWIIRILNCNVWKTTFFNRKNRKFLHVWKIYDFSQIFEDFDRFLKPRKQSLQTWNLQKTTCFFVSKSTILTVFMHSKINDFRKFCKHAKFSEFLTQRIEVRKIQSIFLREKIFDFTISMIWV